MYLFYDKLFVKFDENLQSALALFLPNPENRDERTIGGMASGVGCSFFCIFQENVAAGQWRIRKRSGT